MKIKRIMFFLIMATMLLVLVSCKEATVTSTVTIETAEGKGTLLFDVLIDYSDNTGDYIVNGTEGIANAVEKVIEDLGVACNVTFTEERQNNGQGEILAHVLAEVPFNTIDEYNNIVKKLSNKTDLPLSKLEYVEAEQTWKFTEHSTVITEMVNYLRVLVCDDNTAVNLKPEGKDHHTPDEACNSFYHYIYVGEGTSEKFKIHDYRNVNIGHTNMISKGNFAVVTTTAAATTAAPAPTPTPTTGDSLVYVCVIACVFLSAFVLINRRKNCAK